MYSGTLSYIINPALRTLVNCTLSMTEYFTSENLIETAKDLSKVLFNINFTWGSRNKHFSMSCFKKNKQTKVILA